MYKFTKKADLSKDDLMRWFVEYPPLLQSQLNKYFNILTYSFLILFCKDTIINDYKR